MPEIAPFRAVVYNVDLDPVVSPPYDKISERDRGELMDRSPHNVVRVILPKDGDTDPDGASRDRYVLARAFYDRWLREGVLGKRANPAIYVLSTRFETPGKPGTRERRGLIALLRIDPADNDAVLGHERHFEGPKRDREKLADSLQADLDQLMLLFEDPDGAIRSRLRDSVRSGRPLREARVAARGRDKAEVHALHEITEPGEIAEIQQALADKVLMIADGHHRFAAVAAAARALGRPLWRMVALLPAEDEDVAILATHRLVRPSEPARSELSAIEKAIDGAGALEEPATAKGKALGAGEAAAPPLGADPLADAVAAELDALPATPGAAVLVVRSPGADAPVLRRFIPAEGAAEKLGDIDPALRTLDVPIVQKVIIEGALGVDADSLAVSVDYHRHVDAALSALRKGEGNVLVCLRPTPVADVIAVSKAGARMPQKSTDFYPKLLSGLVGFDHRDAPDAGGQAPDPRSSDDAAPAGDRLQGRAAATEARLRAATRPRLFIPGPTEVHEQVRRALGAPMIGHRGPDYRQLHAEIKPLLRDLFMTEGRVLQLTGSATAGLEAAIRSCVSGKVLNLVNGAFSERWHDITRACGKECVALEVEWGKAIRPDAVAKVLEEKGPFDAVTLVHSETSTGVLNPLFEIAQQLRNHKDTLLMVDTVSSLGTVAVPVDRLRIDVCVTGSQKALALPPGLCLMSVSDRALERAEAVTGRGRYLDIVEMAAYDDRDMTPSTPAISLQYGLRVALERIVEEGLVARFQRHLVMAARCRAWAKERFALFPEEPHVAYGLTTVANTREIDVGELNDWLRSEHGAIIADGYGKLKGKTFRIGHMGETTLDQLDQLLGWIDDFVGR